MAGSPFFIIIVIVAMAVFAIGVAGNALFWLSGRGGPETRPSGPSLGWMGGLVGGSFWRSLFLDSVLQRRLWRLSRLRWLMQIGFVWGTAELFFVGSLGDMLAERGILPIAKDTPAFAALNEVGTILVFLGVGIALYRRFIAREVSLPASPGDIVAIVLLATAVLSGVLVEAVRLLAENIPAGVAWYSFIGHAVALAIRPLAADWSGIYGPAWWIHILFAFGLVAYLPYGKLFHMMVSPVMLAVGAKER